MALPIERSLRSVLVGNIPREATEDQLKEIFSEVGPVLSFRLVYERETKESKGYGFCEYKDRDMAMSAIRNLSGYEVHGRQLRVDGVSSDRHKEELSSLYPAREQQDGDPEKAPEAISKAVASLPPEQMFELMKQMKLCIQNNPNEARNMLLQNPQLAYALLQAQVVMRIVDPEVALAILQRSNTSQQSSAPPATSGSADNQDSNDAVNPTVAKIKVERNDDRRPRQEPQEQSRDVRDQDERGFDPRARDQREGPQAMDTWDPRGSGDQREMRGPPMDPREKRGPMDPREMRATMDNREMRGIMDTIEMRDPRRADPRDQRPPFGAFDPRDSPGQFDNFGRPPGQQESRDPRAPPIPRFPIMGSHMGGPPQPVPAPGSMAGLGPRPVGAPGPGVSQQDQERAALIMQVLQLSDQQIAMLPLEQRTSILVLKEQISRSGP